MKKIILKSILTIVIYVTAIFLFKISVDPYSLKYNFFFIPLLFLCLGIISNILITVFIQSGNFKTRFFKNVFWGINLPSVFSILGCTSLFIKPLAI